jgi:hypothetical protein
VEKVLPQTGVAILNKSLNTRVLDNVEERLSRAATRFTANIGGGFAPSVFRVRREKRVSNLTTDEHVVSMRIRLLPHGKRESARIQVKRSRLRL